MSVGLMYGTLIYFLTFAGETLNYFFDIPFFSFKIQLSPGCPAFCGSNNSFSDQRFFLIMDFSAFKLQNFTSDVNAKWCFSYSSRFRRWCPWIFWKSKLALWSLRRNWSIQPTQNYLSIRKAVAKCFDLVPEFFHRDHSDFSTVPRLWWSFREVPWLVSVQLQFF